MLGGAHFTCDWLDGDHEVSRWGWWASWDGSVLTFPTVSAGIVDDGDDYLESKRVRGAMYVDVADQGERGTCADGYLFNLPEKRHYPGCQNLHFKRGASSVGSFRWFTRFGQRGHYSVIFSYFWLRDILDWPTLSLTGLHYC